MDNNPVREVIANNGAILLTVSGHSARIECDFEGAHCLSQDKVKWIWIRDLVKAVVDQPIVLDINEQSVNVIFQY